MRNKDKRFAIARWLNPSATCEWRISAQSFPAIIHPIRVGWPGFLRAITAYFSKGVDTQLLARSRSQKTEESKLTSDPLFDFCTSLTRWKSPADSNKSMKERKGLKPLIPSLIERIIEKLTPTLPNEESRSRTYAELETTDLELSQVSPARQVHQPTKKMSSWQ